MSNSGNVANAATMARIAELEAMQAELKALKAQVKNTIRMKVSQKGAVSIYGLQRMPVTLYAEQWEKIIDMCKSGDLGTFIMSNEALLTRKGDAPKNDDAAAAVVAAKVRASKPAKTKKATKKTGPSDADLAAIEALNARVSKMPASDLFED